MRKFGLPIALCSLLFALTACSGGGLFRNATHEQAFQGAFYEPTPMVHGHDAAAVYLW